MRTSHPADLSETATDCALQQNDNASSHRNCATGTALLCTALLSHLAEVRLHQIKLLCTMPPRLPCATDAPSYAAPGPSLACPRRLSLLP